MQGQLTHETANTLEISTLQAYERQAALDVIVRGMRDNPLHIAAFGRDADTRVHALRHFFEAAFDVMDIGHHMLAARDAGGTILGVSGMLTPGRCLPTPDQQVQMGPQLAPIGPDAAARLMEWLGTWAAHDPQERHWHLGPVAVDAHLQGRGIGSQLMRAFVERMDSTGETAYLETDKEINVRFYERFGFRVVGEQEILGVPNWFMLRPGRP
jgi:ribosomal protein S18 acetylase RimI-like enzyme